MSSVRDPSSYRIRARTHYHGRALAASDELRSEDEILCPQRIEVLKVSRYSVSSQPNLTVHSTLRVSNGPTPNIHDSATWRSLRLNN